MKQRTFVGIEISGDEIRGAHVRVQSGAAQLVAVASTPTPSGAIDSDGMLNPDAVSGAIRRLADGLDPKSNHVVLGMNGCSLVARVMEIPPVPDAEIRPVLRGEMDHYRILPAGQSAFDFFRLPDLPDHGDEHQEEPIMRVLLMGAEERLVSSYRAAIDHANLNLIAVEPASIALLRSLFPMLRTQGGVASVIVSPMGTDIFITQEGELQFYRRIDTGVPELCNSGGFLDQSMAAPPERSGLLINAEETAVEPVAVSDQEVYNRQAISLLMTEVQRSIDFYLREFPAAGDSMSVRFAVDARDATEMFAVMSQYLRTGAELASVLDTMAVSSEAALALSGPDGFRYNVAVGLALRGIPGYEAAPTLDLGVGDKVVVERRMAPKAMLASAAASGFILLGTVASAFVIGHQISRANRTLTQVRSELSALRQEHATRVARLDRQKNITAAIHNESKPIRETVAFLANAVSRRANLTSLALNPGGQILISGEASTPRMVADIMDRINETASLDPVRLTDLNRVEHDGFVILRFDLQTAFTPFTAEKLAPQKAAAAEVKQGGS